MSPPLWADTALCEGIANASKSAAVAMKITTPLISDIFNCPQASLELKLHVGKERKQDPTVIDVLQGVSRYQRCGAATDDDVLTEWRTIVEARAKIGANAVPNRTLEQQQLQRFSAIEAQVI